MAKEVADNVPDEPLFPGASQWEEALAAEFAEHVREEKEFLQAYRELADKAPPFISYVLRLILEDEARHHKIFLEMSNALQADITWEPISPVVPRVEWGVLERRELDAIKSLLDKTEEFIFGEKEEVDKLVRLRKDLRSVREVTLWPLLVEWIERDTVEHIKALELVRDHLKRVLKSYSD
ncbi:MAG: hypothetical protein M1131_05700 [Actinobacteria bacterium]|jgi:hypothetical protein|nr:hypothetical protein [Actinomycetota bacterium]MCL6094376.1 hypothetical protein [Actinomycetota bacterium]